MRAIEGLSGDTRRTDDGRIGPLEIAAVDPIPVESPDPLRVILPQLAPLSIEAIAPLPVEAPGRIEVDLPRVTPGGEAQTPAEIRLTPADFGLTPGAVEFDPQFGELAAAVSKLAAQFREAGGRFGEAGGEPTARLGEQAARLRETDGGLARTDGADLRADGGPTDPLIIQAIDPLPVDAPDAIRVDVGMPMIPTLGVEAPPPIQVEAIRVTVDVPEIDPVRIDPLRLDATTIEPLRVVQPEPLVVRVPEVPPFQLEPIDLAPLEALLRARGGLGLTAPDRAEEPSRAPVSTTEIHVEPIPAIRVEDPPLIGFGPAPRVTLDAPETLPRFEAPEIDPIEVQPIEPVRVIVPGFEALQVEPTDPIGVTVPRFDPLTVERVDPIRVILPRFEPLELGTIEPLRVETPGLTIDPPDLEPLEAVLRDLRRQAVDTPADRESQARAAVEPLRDDRPSPLVLPPFTFDLPSPPAVQRLEIPTRTTDPVEIAQSVAQSIRPIIQQPARSLEALAPTQRQDVQVQITLSPQVSLNVSALDGSSAAEAITRIYPELRDRLTADLQSGAVGDIRRAIQEATR